MYVLGPKGVPVVAMPPPPMKFYWAQRRKNNEVVVVLLHSLVSHITRKSSLRLRISAVSIFFFFLYFTFFCLNFFFFFFYFFFSNYPFFFCLLLALTGQGFGHRWDVLNTMSPPQLQRGNPGKYSVAVVSPRSNALFAWTYQHCLTTMV
jgi:hypothetical protein